MNDFGHEAPLVRLVLPFIAGIISSVYIQDFSSYLLLFSLLVFLIGCIALHKKIYQHFRYRWIFGLLTYLFFFLMGYELTHLHTEINHPNHFQWLANESKEVIVKINDPIRLKQKSISTTAEILKIKEEGNWKDTQGKIMLHIQTDSNSLQLEYGDVLAIYGSFNEISPPQNPFEFDYKQYLSFHSIYHQTYINSQNWELLSKKDGNPIFYYSYAIQKYLANLFSKYEIQGQELSVISALLLGTRENIDPALTHAYASTGALHVLSVSGLHVGLIYFVFNFFLAFILKLKHGQQIKAAILLLFLWSYAFITGLPPSVVRAAGMFSFMVIGQSINRHVNIYNILAASAFLQLLINPYILMEVGFQLSYLAVIGIVWLQPKIYNLLYTPKWLWDKIWSLTSVSLAAQLITFPLGLLYFHQFPNYFLVSNLIVIPVSTLIIYLALGLLALSPIPYISMWIAKLLIFLLKLLNISVVEIEKLPYSLLEGISISIFQTWLLYVIIISGVFFLSYKKQKAIYFLCLSVIIFLVLELVEKNNQIHQQKLIVYTIPGESAVDIIDGESDILLASQRLLKNESKMLFHIKHNWWELGIENTNVFSSLNELEYANRHTFIKKQFVQLGNQKIVLLKNDSLLHNSINFHRISIDYLILSENLPFSISTIQKFFHFKYIIFDSSNSFYRIKKWKEECERLVVPYFDVRSNGAFEKTFNQRIIE